MLALTGVVAGLSIGCEDSFIDPFANEERYYTIYGFLDEGKNTQVLVPHEVRVIPVTRFPQRITSPLHPQANLDAEVFSRDLDASPEADSTIEWIHSLEQLDDGLFAHIFRATFNVKPGHTYRLEVHRSDGVVAWAETTVPSLSSLIPEPVNLRVLADSITILQDILIPGAIPPWQIAVSYDVVGQDCMLDRGVTTPLPYGNVGEETPEGWRFTVNISEDLVRLAQRLDRPNVFFCVMGLRIRWLDTRWRTAEGNDENELALPTAFSNVENGYGFFGSVGVLHYEWPASPALLRLIRDEGR